MPAGCAHAQARCTVLKSPRITSKFGSFPGDKRAITWTFRQVMRSTGMKGVEIAEKDDHRSRRPCFKEYRTSERALPAKQLLQRNCWPTGNCAGLIHSILGRKCLGLSTSPQQNSDKSKPPVGRHRPSLAEELERESIASNQVPQLPVRHH